MKLIIEQSLDCKETEIRIICGLMDDRLKHLIEQIRTYTFSIVADDDGASVPVALEKIYYFESVDNKTFLYMDKSVFKCDSKLYELEELLRDTAFVRISKSCILNTAVVESVKAEFSGRLEARLINGEKLIVSKHYIAAFRAKFC